LEEIDPFALFRSTYEAVKNVLSIIDLDSVSESSAVVLCVLAFSLELCFAPINALLGAVPLKLRVPQYIDKRSKYYVHPDLPAVLFLWFSLPHLWAFLSREHGPNRTEHAHKCGTIQHQQGHALHYVHSSIPVTATMGMC